MVARSVLQALELELAKLKKTAPDLASGSLATLAETLAKRLDDLELADTAVGPIARVLLDTLTKLRELQPEVPPKDALDGIAVRRAARLARRAATTNPPPAA